MRSMRARRSLAAASGWTVNGSVGARRKRDFVFMPSILYLEGVADARKSRRARTRRDRVARPRRAAADRQRQVVDEHDVERQLAAHRRSDLAGAECAVPGVAGV